MEQTVEQRSDSGGVARDLLVEPREREADHQSEFLDVT